MSSPHVILSAEKLGDAIVIHLADGSMVYLTAEQIPNSGIPRFIIPAEEESFEDAIRAALDRTGH